MAASGVVYVNDKPFSLAQEIIDAGIPAIRAALAIDVPDIENADIVLDEPKSPGEPRTAQIVKRGMGKGAGDDTIPLAQRHLIEKLSRAPEYVNPAIRLAAELQRAELAGDSEAIARAVRTGELERAVAAGERQGRAVHRALIALSRANPVPSKVAPEGF